MRTDTVTIQQSAIFFSASAIDIDACGVKEERPTPSAVEDNAVIVNSPRIQLSMEEETEFPRTLVFHSTYKALIC